MDFKLQDQFKFLSLLFQNVQYNQNSNRDRSFAERSTEHRESGRYFSIKTHDLYHTQFFDFEHWVDIKSDLMRSITRLPQSSGPIEKGERLSVNFKGITSLVTVLVRPTFPAKREGIAGINRSRELMMLFWDRRIPSRSSSGGMTCCM